MRTARASLLVAFVLAACGVGCASLLGADFDRPGASADDSGTADATSNAVDGGSDAGSEGDASLACDGGPCVGTWTLQGDPAVLMYATQVWGTGPKEIYALSQEGMLSSEGDGTWGPRVLATESNVNGRAVWAAGGDYYWALTTSAEILHTSQSAWELQDAGKPQLALWGSGPNDIYSGGSYATILHSTGNGTWTVQKSEASLNTAHDIRAIWGSGPTDIYAINTRDVLHSTGNGTWTTVFTAPSDIYGLWGSGSDVYVVGDKAGIYHRGADGQWKAQASGSPITMLFWSVWGSGPGDIYIGGQDGVILHGKGDGAWTPEVDQLKEAVVSIWGSSSTDVYAVTMRDSDARGSILHRTPPP